jgi:hypothetical protein
VTTSGQFVSSLACSPIWRSRSARRAPVASAQPLASGAPWRLAVAVAWVATRFRRYADRINLYSPLNCYNSLDYRTGDRGWRARGRGLRRSKGEGPSHHPCERDDDRSGGDIYCGLTGQNQRVAEGACSTHHRLQTRETRRIVRASARLHGQHAAVRPQGSQGRTGSIQSNSRQS